MQHVKFFNHYTILIFVILCSLAPSLFADTRLTDPYALVKVDRVIVEKQKRKLSLLSGDDVIKQYEISLGRNPEGPKIYQGDNRTPEGVYFIDYRVEESDYHKALHISYPNQQDLERARQMGLSPGGDIMLHGLKNGDRQIEYFHGYFDWTYGCIAVTNMEIEEIWQLVPNGTPIEILP